ncbi:MAG TPA: TOBE domain-containing protein, partial [Stellaceae bacterium]|nr:TOBE domain-containing protein [Stellaceae bacterium]
GGVNLFEGRVVETRADGLAIDCAELDQCLVVAGAGVAIGSAVAIAVRPERIELSAAPSARPNCLSATVTDVSYRGEASSVNLALANGRRVRVTLPNLGRTGGPRLVPGAALWLGWAPEAGVLLTS